MDCARIDERVVLATGLALAAAGARRGVRKPRGGRGDVYSAALDTLDYDNRCAAASNRRARLWIVSDSTS